MHPKICRNVNAFLLVQVLNVCCKFKPKIKWFNQCFSTGGPRPSGGSWSFLAGRKAFHILLKIRLSDTNFMQMYKKSTLSATKATISNKIS